MFTQCSGRGNLWPWLRQAAQGIDKAGFAARESAGRIARRPVSRVLSRPLAGPGTAIPLGRPLPGASRDRPGRRRGNPRAGVLPPACRPYLVLLPVGFAVPPLSPGARCALTAPFHPYRRGYEVPWPAVCSLWHCPWGRPRRALPGTAFPWSPDFPPPSAGSRTPQAAAVRPSGRGQRIGMRPRRHKPATRPALMPAARAAASPAVSGSIAPSTRVGRKWRWKAVTTATVCASSMPVASIS